ncbi:MAG TPA: recombination mediator RecR, partial [Turneriella sp.]|nr:recombination mediator RecR [Turneriella sp.]
FVKKGPVRVSNFTHTLEKLASGVATCAECGAFCSAVEKNCTFCVSSKRNFDTLCVVANASDIYAVENTGEHHGLYHVLGGVLSPLDGVGPEELNIPKLFERVKSLHIKEVIVATNPSVEGNATGHYIADAVKPLGVRVTRIATGLALGQLLDYAETQAISQSLRQRVEL